MADFTDRFTNKDDALREFSDRVARLIEVETATIVRTMGTGDYGHLVGVELSWIHVEPCDKPCCTHPASAVFTVIARDD